MFESSPLLAIGYPKSARILFKSSCNVNDISLCLFTSSCSLSMLALIKLFPFFSDDNRFSCFLVRSNKTFLLISIVALWGTSSSLSSSLSLSLSLSVSLSYKNATVRYFKCRINSGTFETRSKSRYNY